jgi:TonB family protein
MTALQHSGAEAISHPSIFAGSEKVSSCCGAATPRTRQDEHFRRLSDDKLSYLCHKSFMKNAVICSLAFALVSPAALADSAKSQSTPYAISVKSAVTPVAHSEFRYPYLAARQGLDGACDVVFEIDAQGRPRSVDVISCSSAGFEREAKSIVQGMTFPATGSSIRSAEATIRWDINPKQYASLD